jgi:hypothetical protein
MPPPRPSSDLAESFKVPKPEDELVPELRLASYSEVVHQSV